MDESSEQAIIDTEHLRLLQIAYFIDAGTNPIWVFFPDRMQQRGMDESSEQAIIAAPFTEFQAANGPLISRRGLGVHPFPSLVPSSLSGRRLAHRSCMVVTPAL